MSSDSWVLSDPLNNLNIILRQTIYRVTEHRALLSIMREITANKSYNSRLTRWIDRLLAFDFTIDQLLGSKMGLVDYISRDPQQKAVNISAYDEQFIVAKLDVIRRSAKRFLLNAENYVNFAARNPLTKQTSNTPNSTNKLCSEFAPRNPEYSSITDSDNSINKSTPNNSNSNIQIETANLPHSLLALNRPTDQLLSQSNNFQRNANKFKTVYMMSHSNADEKNFAANQAIDALQSEICGRGRTIDSSSVTSNASHS